MSIHTYIHTYIHGCYMGIIGVMGSPRWVIGESCGLYGSQVGYRGGGLCGL